MKRILITGINSYIGSSVADYLKQWPLLYKTDAISMRDDTWQNIDLSVYDTILHVAGLAHVDTGKISEDEKKMYYSINTELTIALAQAAKASGVKQFIYMSSAIIYGKNTQLGMDKVITKETIPQPDSYYGDSKLQAEKGLMLLQSVIFNVAIVRSPMVYGKHCKGNYNSLVRIALHSPFFPRVNNHRSMIYIDNLAEFLRLLITNNESGMFWPQNAEYSNTSEMVLMISQAHHKKMYLIGIFEDLILWLSKYIPQINKAFGSMCYEQGLSKYKDNYQLFSLYDSIRRTEEKL